MLAAVIHNEFITETLSLVNEKNYWKADCLGPEIFIAHITIKMCLVTYVKPKIALSDAAFIAIIYVRISCCSLKIIFDNEVKHSW